jgi:hypothetical protein
LANRVFREHGPFQHDFPNLIGQLFGQVVDSQVFEVRSGNGSTSDLG